MSGIVGSALLPFAIFEYVEPKNYIIPEVKFEALKHGGLRAIIPDSPGMNVFAINVNINKPIDVTDPGMLAGESTTAEDNFRVIELDTTLKVGDIVNYRIWVVHENLSHEKDRLSWKVQELKDSYSPLSDVVVNHSYPANVRISVN